MTDRDIRIFDNPFFLILGQERQQELRIYANRQTVVITVKLGTRASIFRLSKKDFIEGLPWIKK